MSPIFLNPIMDLELTVKDDDEITLPKSIATSALTLAEIGAVVCMASIQMQDPDDEGIAVRLKSPEMLTALKSLRNRKVLEVVTEGKCVFIKLNLGEVGC